MQIYKRKAFQQWQQRVRLPDSVLCRTAKELEAGLIDADLGGHLYKMRVARSGSGKSSGHRLLVSARIANRCVFLYGFSKSNRSNITWAEISALQHAGHIFLNLDAEALFQALHRGILLKVKCNEQAH